MELSPLSRLGPPDRGTLLAANVYEGTLLDLWQLRQGLARAVLQLARALLPCDNNRRRRSSFVNTC
jgi:hypothetical protein